MLVAGRGGTSSRGGNMPIQVVGTVSTEGVVGRRDPSVVLTSLRCTGC